MDTDLRPLSVHGIASQLARTPAALTVWLEDLPTDLWHHHEVPGAWSPFEVIGHLVHGEDDDWIPRIRVVLQPTEPRRFTPFDREGGMAKYGHHAPRPLLALFAAKRRASLVTLNELQITDAMLSCTAVHPEFGEVTLAQLLACWVTHDQAHMAQIARVLTRGYGAFVGPWGKYFSLLRQESDR